MLELFKLFCVLRVNDGLYTCVEHHETNRRQFCHRLKYQPRRVCAYLKVVLEKGSLMQKTEYALCFTFNLIFISLHMYARKQAYIYQ